MDPVRADETLLAWSHAQQQPPAPLAPVVRDMMERGMRVVTLTDLDAYATGMPAERIARVGTDYMRSEHGSSEHGSAAGRPAMRRFRIRRTRDACEAARRTPTCTARCRRR